MSLKDLARINGKKLNQLGLHPVHASQINIGTRRAGAVSLQKIANSLGLSTAEVAAACDPAWQAKQRPTAPDASAVDPGANGAQVAHGGDPIPAAAS